MKKFVAISLLSLYVISLTELSQLVKLPLLVEHFIEHKEKDSNLSLLEFLSMHYVQSDDHDGDRDKDMNLPFKSHNGCIHTLMIAFTPNIFEQFIIKPLFTESKTPTFYFEKFSPSSFHSFIWQPPKSC